MKKIAIALVFSFVWLFNTAQTVQVLVKDKKASFRGLCVVNDKVIWVSGSGGTVGRSVDGGDTWKWFTVKGFEKTDFRDIEAFNDKTAVIMGIDTPAVILKTTDAGENWKVVFEDKTPGMFLDAMEFWNDKAGIVIGDPVDGKFFVARTFDGGMSWQEIPLKNRPEADSGEACFASSGTNIAVLDRDEAVFVSGGLRSRLFTRNPPVNLPLIQGTESTGANSIAVWNNRKMQGGRKMIVVGGDFTQAAATQKNCFYSNDRGKTWNAPVTPPHGYRSCVAYFTMDKAVSCGLNGIDITTDGGQNWTWISQEGFHVCRKAKNGNLIFFAGNNGKIGKIAWN